MERLIEAERGVVPVRWFGAGCALFQVGASSWAAGPGAGGAPDYLLPVALGLIAGLAAFNLVLMRWVRRRSAAAPPYLLHRAGALALVIDHVFLISLVWLYSNQSNTAAWTLLLVLPMEAALCYETPGALLSIGVVAATEVARQVIRYPSTLGAGALASVTFRLGMLTLIGLLAGLMIRNRNDERAEVERRAAQLEELAAEQAELAVHDPLTGLPNRELFRQRVAAAVAAAAESGIRAAVMLMDLDRFKEINDTLGHHNGDRVLTVLARRLAGKVGEGSTVARLGGDEFGILFPTMSDPLGAVAAARDVLELLEEPVAIEGLALHIEGSIGVAVYPEHGEDADQLIQRADVALSVTKASQDGVGLYSAARDGYRPSRLALMGELRRALDNDELTLYYQPQLDLASGRVRSVEALVRWRHPARGLVLPDEFIPLAERTGLIRPLTLQVLDMTVRQWAEWRRQGRNLEVSANLSARNLHDPDLAHEVSRLLWKGKIPPGQLTLEITESAVMGDPGRALDLLPRLRGMGLRLSIDDFGTGYSSLAYLKQMPVGQVKVDRSFVTHVHQDATDAAIVRGTIDLAHNLGLEVVAEGVETAPACETVRSLGCDVAQGWWLSEPLPAAQLTAWLDSRQERTGRNALA